MKGEQEDGKLSDKNGKNNDIDIYLIISRYNNILLNFS